MKFDKLVTGVLKESNTPTITAPDIPALDGEREVWLMRVTDELVVRRLFRIYQYTRWDGCARSCIIPSYQQTKDIAIKHFIEQCKTIDTPSADIDHGVKLLNEELSKLKNITGTYKIIDNFGLPLSWDTEEFVIGVEVDVHAHKVSSHAAEELVGF